MATQIEAFNWILTAKTLSELNDVKTKIESLFIDVGFAKYAYILRFNELKQMLGKMVH